MTTPEMLLIPLAALLVLAWLWLCDAEHDACKPKVGSDEAE